MKARVRRLGQSRETFVKHFVVENTIEERIYKLGR
jgi:SNF2 family DNA or RNA helicase